MPSSMSPRVRAMLRAMSVGVKRELAWAMFRVRAPAQGFSAAELTRFRPYLAGRWGSRDPGYTHALQRPKNYFPGLRAKPLHDVADFPWAATLEAAYPVIKAEVLEARSWAHTHQQNLVDAGHWNVLYLFSVGRKVEDGHRLCPKTAAVLASIPGVGEAGQAYLSVLSKNTHIAPHCGPTNTRLRCHLGISVPQGCRIRVGAESYRWQEGKCLIFDDSFEHEVWHEGEEDRIVLVLDVWHPELRPAEIWAIKEMSRLSRADRNYWRRSRRQDQPPAGDASMG